MAALSMTASTAKALTERPVRSSRQSAVIMNFGARPGVCCWRRPKLALQILEAGAPTFTAAAGLEQIQTNEIAAKSTDTLESLTQQIDASFVTARRSGASVTFVQLVLASREPAWGWCGRQALLEALVRQAGEQADERYEVALLLVAAPHSEAGARAFELLDRVMPTLDTRGSLRLRFAR